MNKIIDIELMVILNKLSYTLLNNLGKDLARLGMTVSEYSILAHLNVVKRAKTQKLGEVSLITSGTITHTLRKLIKKGFVFQEQDKNDKRILWVCITQKGVDEFEQVHRQHLLYLKKLLEDFSKEEKETLIENMKMFGLGIENKIKELQEEI